MESAISFWTATLGFVASVGALTGTMLILATVDI
jgi:hypothetical protein